MNSADVYASHDLFTKLWPKLLSASAVESVSEFQSGQKFEPATAVAVQAALHDADSAKGVAKHLTGRTALLGRARQGQRGSGLVVVNETPQNILFETHDRGQAGAWIHRNYLTK